MDNGAYKMNVEEIIEDLVKEAKKNSKLVEKSREPHWFALKVNGQIEEIIPWYQGEPEVDNFKHTSHVYEKPEVVKVRVVEV